MIINNITNFVDLINWRKSLDSDSFNNNPFRNLSLIFLSVKSVCSFIESMYYYLDFHVLVKSDTCICNWLR